MDPFAILVSPGHAPEGPLAPDAPGSWAPALDVYDTPTALVVQVELPGTAPGDVRVVCYPRSLVIQGTKGQALPGGRAAVRQCLRVERTAGAFRRVVPLPYPVDRERGAARLADGVLTVTLPRGAR